MSQQLSDIMIADAISAQRQDQTISRQGVMNHQSSAHMQDLVFLQSYNELSIPEALAIQRMFPQEAAFANLAAQTPKKTGP